MESQLGAMMKRIGFSPTLKISAKAKAMRAEGIDVIDLSVGEPDFPTPKNIREAGKRAIDEGFTTYTPASGLPVLKKAVAEKLWRDNGLEYDPATEIIVSCGAKSSLYHLLRATVTTDQEVLIPAPYWVSYPEMVKLAHGIPVIVPTDESDGFRLRPDQLKASLSANTRAIILNNPSNPTGSTYRREQLIELCEIAAEEGLVIVADEIYEHLVYDGLEFQSIASFSENIRNHTVVVNGVSKAYSMTGWRIGYAAGPAEIVGGMGRIQSHSTSNPTTISQIAAVEALNGPQDEIAFMREEFLRRRNYMYSRLTNIPGITCHKSEGAFYLFPNFSHYYGWEFEGARIRNSYGMSYHLLRNANVAVVPGEAFGADPFIRLSYATSMEKIEQAMDRIVDSIAALRPSRKGKLKALRNTETKVRDMLPVESHLSVDLRDAAVVEADEFLSDETYFEWNANIAGSVVQLRTNHRHLNDWFVENFYPATLESDIEPHGVLYALAYMKGREPGATYNTDTRTGFVYRSGYYGQVRSMALGIATDVAERTHDLHAVRGMVLDVNGEGVLLMGNPGAGKTAHLADLMRRADTRLVTNDMVFIRHGGSESRAICPERKLYMPTRMARRMASLVPLLEKSNCENVVERAEDCELGDDHHCPIEQGAPYCFVGSPDSRAMLDPYWLGADRHVKETVIRHVLIVSREAVGTAVRKLDEVDAVRYLEESRTADGTPLPFQNPHLLVRTMERTELQRRNFRRLARNATVHALNVERMTPEETRARIHEILGI
ncbi:MAG: aminotransferase class I/II-fold pyridoxal phosphate-dependent enzyme [Planctomycetota bacterium]